MTNLKLSHLYIRNFKGIEEMGAYFGYRTDIYGANATGKTTVVDALWFLLFDKDSSGNQKFEVRPLNEEGKKIHNVDIIVEGEFDNDGTSFTLKKIQREKWVKRRGSDTTELQGNTNSYEINGYPRSESEYKAFISQIIDDELFKIMTSPGYFPDMPWKQQREILMRFVSDRTDAELAGEIGGYDDIIDELAKAPSTDDIVAKYRKEMAVYRKQQDELPVRIDEVARQKQHVDVKALKGERAELVKKLNAITNEIEERKAEERRVIARRNELSDEILHLKSEEKSVLANSRVEYSEKRNDLRMRTVIAGGRVNEYTSQINGLRDKIAAFTHKAEDLEKNKEILRKDWERIRGVEYTGQDICLYCGQQLPHNHIEEAQKKFAEEQKRKLSYIEEEAKKINVEIAWNNEQAEDKRKECDLLCKEMKSFQSEYDAASKELERLVEPSEPEAVSDIREKIYELQEAYDAIDDIEDTSQLSIDESTLESTLRDIDKQMEVEENNRRLDERIVALTEEQREVAKKYAFCEKKLYLVECFIRDKLDRISQQINGKFEGVEWLLFERQINGGMKETCECMVNGVPYSDVNSGHKIVAGLNIIKALQNLYGIKVPVIIDNCESLNSFNIPKIDCQMITLSVSGDPYILFK